LASIRFRSAYDLFDPSPETSLVRYLTQMADDRDLAAADDATLRFGYRDT